MLTKHWTSNVAEYRVQIQYMLFFPHKAYVGAQSGIHHLLFIIV